MISKVHRFHGLGSLRPTYRFGKSVRADQLVLRYRVNPKLSDYRAAVVVSKKIHKQAVHRNRVRRRIYEAIRLNQPQIDPKYELIFSVFSDRVIDWSPEKLQKAITDLLQKSGALKG